MVDIYFSDFFSVAREVLDEYGAFDISLVTDLPLFIDPFLLFNSTKQEYQELHQDIIKYLRFLKEKSLSGIEDEGSLKAWFYFSEVKETWLGFCEDGNRGRGLGSKFAQALRESFQTYFSDFGEEMITKGSHLEKLCLIKPGVGKDNISDFTTNLIKQFLLEYTQEFTLRHIDPSLQITTAVTRVKFNYDTEVWMPRTFQLPKHGDHFVILTPTDILTRDDTWINKTDLIERFAQVPLAIDNAQLRAQINNYFHSVLPKEPKKSDFNEAARNTILRFPEVIDYYIKYKEERADVATRISTERVASSTELYLWQFGAFAQALDRFTDFFRLKDNSNEATLKRIEFLKDVIENKGGHKYFYLDNKPIRREKDLQILYRLTWFGTEFDVSREVNDGRGPADFKISRGLDKSIVEFKLASNSKLKSNLANQAEIYSRASDASSIFKVIMYFTKEEHLKVKKILEELGMSTNPNVVLIDARKDNKPSGSKA